MKRAGGMSDCSRRQRPGGESEAEEGDREREKTAAETFDMLRELQEARAWIQGGGVLRDESRATRRSQVSKDLVSQEQEFGLFPKSSRKPLRGFKHEQVI